MSTVFHDLGVTVQTGNNVIPNPGTGNTLNFNGMSHATCTLSAGTYKLPNSNPGTQVTIIATGAVVLTNADGSAVDTLASGEMRVYMARTTAIWTSEVATVLTHLLSVQGITVGAPLTTLRIVDTSGDVGSTTGAGGTLASNTTPILRGEATTEALAVHWAAADTSIVATNVTLPPDLDHTADMYIDLVVQTNNTAELPEFTVLSNFNGGTQVTGDTTAAATSTTAIQTITATIAASDVVAASSLGFQLVPSTHGTHAWTLFGVRVRGKRSLLSA